MKNYWEEIKKITDYYFPYYVLISIPVDYCLFHYIDIIGVYILYSHKEIIYIGFSSNVGRRLLSHFSETSKFKDKPKKIDIIRFQFSDNPLEAEAQLIKQFNPPYNKENRYLNFVPLPLNFDLEETINQIKKRLGIE